MLVGAPHDIDDALLAAGSRPYVPGRDPGADQGLDGRDAQTRRARFVPSSTKEHRHGRHDRESGGRHSDPTVHHRVSRSGARGAARAYRGHALAREGDGRRPVAGRAARDDPGARARVGDRLRLGQVRGEAERAAALRHRDRRAGHPLRPRSLEARRRAAADRHARMAGLDHRAAEDHRSAHRSHGTRRERVGRLPRGDPLDAGLRVLRQADAAPAGAPSAWAGPGQS